VRKLTPLESWRVMGFKDDDFFKAQTALNNTFYGGKDMSKGHLYKMAGNSIVVDTVKVILSAVLDYL
jgi:DNA (cytosine-5)-methyltransferase 1